MHMVILVFRTSLEDEVFAFLDGDQIQYTRLEEVRGKGVTGTVPGSLTFGGANTVILTAVPEERVKGVHDKIQQFHTQLKSRFTVPLPFHAFVLPCVQWC